ncbi:MAG: N-acetylmuramoyl-L-alanine amidase, partial [candidate division Zixibacteria bacterium]|nr:N-acetylmuramoyl-L-alanine amidase [candidate division Zixibacteria bacterium]
GIPSRGVDQAAFVALNRVYMPAALVEAAFISNAKEENLLRDKKFRKKVAQSIYNALKTYKRRYESQN